MKKASPRSRPASRPNALAPQWMVPRLPHFSHRTAPKRLEKLVRSQARVPCQRHSVVVEERKYKLVRMLTSCPDGVLIAVRVIPRAGRAGMAGTRNNALLVRLNAAPVDGAANAELIELLARALDIPRRNIEIVAGHRSRTKSVRITGVTSADVAEKLCAPERTS